MKNAHGKMFGGYLMHKAIEQAFIAAKWYSGSTNPKITHMDTVQFFKPVKIGAMM